MSSSGGEGGLEDTLEAFVEEFGLWYDRVGVPRMAGRILGWLLVCDPPAQTMQEIATQLQASMGSISTMTRMLEQIGLIARETTPGERRVRYRVLPYAFSTTWEDQLRNARTLQTLVDRALEALDASDPDRRSRLAVTRQFTEFYIEQLPRLIREWDARIGDARA
jgi:DNA-binding transcriptional regulator GbsR (MarR family)